jgi:hypothetical protein
MKFKLTSALLSFAVLTTISTTANAKPRIDYTKIVNNPLTVNIARPLPISLWKFSSPNQDLGGLLTRQSISDWNRILIVSKPYRGGGSTVKPFAQWGLENLKRDLGDSYTPKQADDWQALAILTKPYR